MQFSLELGRSLVLFCYHRRSVAACDTLRSSVTRDHRLFVNGCLDCCLLVWGTWRVHPALVVGR
jgi:hypothetical protein